MAVMGSGLAKREGELWRHWKSVGRMHSGELRCEVERRGREVKDATRFMIENIEIRCCRSTTRFQQLLIDRHRLLVCAHARLQDRISRPAVFRC